MPTFHSCIVCSDMNQGGRVDVYVTDDPANRTVLEVVRRLGMTEENSALIVGNAVQADFPEPQVVNVWASREVRHFVLTSPDRSKEQLRQQILPHLVRAETPPA